MQESGELLIEELRRRGATPTLQSGRSTRTRSGVIWFSYVSPNAPRWILPLMVRGRASMRKMLAGII